MTNFGKLMLAFALLLLLAVVFAFIQRPRAIEMVKTAGTPAVSVVSPAFADNTTASSTDTGTASTTADTGTAVMADSSSPSIVTGNKEDLISFTITPGSSVSGQIKASGAVQNGYFFEGNILLNIEDQNKNVLKSGNGMATGEWMTTGPVPFDADLDFTGLPKGPAYIEIKNDNPSGNPANDKFIWIPVVIK